MRMGLHWRPTKQPVNARTSQQSVITWLRLHAVNAHLEEPADVRLVIRTHEHDVLEEPEEGPVVVLLGPHHGQHAVELEEQPAGAL